MRDADIASWRVAEAQADALDRLKWDARFNAPAFSCIADVFLCPTLLLLLGLIGWGFGLFGA